MYQGKITDMIDLGVMENFKYKFQVLMSASEAADRVLDCAQCSIKKPVTRCVLVHSELSPLACLYRVEVLLKTVCEHMGKTRWVAQRYAREKYSLLVVPIRMLLLY